MLYFQIVTPSEADFCVPSSPASSISRLHSPITSMATNEGSKPKIATSSSKKSNGVGENGIKSSYETNQSHTQSSLVTV